MTPEVKKYLEDQEIDPQTLDAKTRYALETVNSSDQVQTILQYTQYQTTAVLNSSNHS